MAKVAEIVAGVALIATSFLTGGAGLVLGTQLISYSSVAFGLGVAVALRGVSQLLQRPPTTAASLASRGTSGINPIAPRQIVYGRPRIAGTITFKSFTGQGYGGTGDNFLYLVITLSGRKIHSINNLYLNGSYVHLDGSGNSDQDVFAKGIVHAEFNLGTDTQAAFPGLIADSNGLWTDQHQQKGCAGAYLKININKEPFNGAAPNATFDVQGCEVYDPRNGDPADSSAWGYSNNAALVTADFIHSRNGFSSPWSAIDSALLIASANLCDEPVELTPITAFGGVGLDDMTVSGTYSGAANPQTFYIRVSTTADTDNFQWLEGNSAGGTWSDELTMTGAAQSLADGMSVTFAATTGHTKGDPWNFRAGTEPRFCIDGTIDTTEDQAQVLTEMAAAMAGTDFFIAGKWLILPGAFRTPYPTALTENDFTESLKVTILRSRKDLINAFKGTYIPSDHSQPIDFPAYIGASYVLADGETIYRDAMMRFTNSSSACQRIGKIAVEKNRRQKTVSVGTKLAGYETQPGDVRKLTFPRYSTPSDSWTNKTFDVIGVQFAIKQDSKGVPLHTVGITFAEIDEDVYSWLGSEEIVQAVNPEANVVPIPPPWSGVPPAPVSWLLTANLEGDLRLSFAIPENADYETGYLNLVYEDEKNRVETTLVGALADTDTTFTVASSGQYVDSTWVGFLVGDYVNIGLEIVKIVGPGIEARPPTNPDDSISTVWEVARGVVLTYAAPALDGAAIYRLTSTTLNFSIDPGYALANPTIDLATAPYFVHRFQPGRMRILWAALIFANGSGQGSEDTAQASYLNGVTDIPGDLPGLRTCDGGYGLLEITDDLAVGQTAAFTFQDNHTIGEIYAAVDTSPGGADIHLQLYLDGVAFGPEAVIPVVGDLGASGSGIIVRGAVQGNVANMEISVVITQIGSDPNFPGNNLRVYISV